MNFKKLPPVQENENFNVFLRIIFFIGLILVFIGSFFIGVVQDTSPIPAIAYIPLVIYGLIILPIHYAVLFYIPLEEDFYDIRHLLGAMFFSATAPAFVIAAPQDQKLLGAGAIIVVLALNLFVGYKAYQALKEDQELNTHLDEKLEAYKAAAIKRDEENSKLP